MATGTGLAPFRPFRSLLTREPAFTFQQRLNRLFEDPFGPLAFFGEEPVSITAWTPSVDIFETETEIVVKAEIPGIKKDDVKLNVQDNVLTISGERKFEQETKKENYLRVERGYGNFTRSFTLPPSVDFKKITAEFKDGLLEVKLPKMAEAKPKEIEIKIK
jgi:HSP20 family protein